MSTKKKDNTESKQKKPKQPLSEDLRPVNPAIWTDADDRYFQAPLRLFWLGLVVILVSTLIVYAMSLLAMTNPDLQPETQAKTEVIETEKAAEPPSQRNISRDLSRRRVPGRSLR